MKTLGKYSFGLGDRFGHQGGAQLKAIISAAEKGVEITPVWNKSNREHLTIGTVPEEVRTEADSVVAGAEFKKEYFVDADHINNDTVDKFIACSDFFTIDVASYIGKQADPTQIEEFMKGIDKYSGGIGIPGSGLNIKTSDFQIRMIAKRYLFAAIKASEIYSKIEKVKGYGNFITEVSMDEVHDPQTPVELLFILKMLAHLNIPLQTIAPKFSGRFNKGVDYVGDPQVFADEFEKDLHIIDFAIKEFGLPENLKISVHSGSDKFAIYPYIGELITRLNKGIHVKTAGTTWLEEVIGLAVSGGNGLKFAKEIYYEALDKTEDLCAPYADVIDIKLTLLPSKTEVSGWNGRRFADSLKHVRINPDYNPDMRQLIHVAYKLAAHRREEFFMLLDENEKTISDCVFDNIYNRHICRLFGLEKICI
jgi:tagaturonate epimerase